MFSVMLSNKLRIVSTRFAINYVHRSVQSIAVENPIHRRTNENKLEECDSQTLKKLYDVKLTTTSASPSSDTISGDLGLNRNLEAKESVVLPFDDVPGPKSLKYLSFARRYLSEIGTQLTAGALTLGFYVRSFINNNNATKKFSSLFDEYGPVVRFISPVGNDIVLLNNPEHIQKVFKMEGEYPVRSTLDSLEKYRTEYRNPYYTGLLNLNGEEWHRQREATCPPLGECLTHHLPHLYLVCDRFTEKIYKMRNYQDEVTNDLYKEIHKWAFECMGHIIFSKTFNLLDNDTISSQDDMMWFYHSLEKASEGLMKCESGMQFWRIMPTPAWNKLVKYCDSLDNLIGKQVVDAEQRDVSGKVDEPCSLMHALLLGRQEKLKTEAVTTILMDMMLLGVNTVSTTATFLLYHLAKYQRVQKVLYNELANAGEEKQKIEDFPYLNACLKESLRLVPPIPVITRVLPRNIVLDRFNIPSGTLVIMSTQDAGVKESHFDDASRFYPERWLQPEPSDSHEFAYIPFGFGARKCLGKDVAETMVTVLVKKMLKRFKLEYHYGDILPTRTFIAKPNRQLKLRLIDRF